jgi:hypothetical protein
MPEQAKWREAITTMPRGRGQRYAPELKSQAIAWAQAERRAGESWKKIAEATGVHATTLRAWCKHGGEARMRRVQVVKDQAAPTLSVVSPSGYKIEGLTLSEATALLGKLG